ncbi:MAG: helix-turn-helix transcriptional regulator [Clostridia bacterium]|nr:helix-turn-helix transcriptional regulator [Clostridia bacterium]
MEIQSICPLLYRLSYFKYVNGAQEHSKISRAKSQYGYHILLIDKGTLDVCFGNKKAQIKAGDALYLLPGEVYRLLPCGKDFSLYNLFFYFRDDHTDYENRYQNCVFIQYFDPDFCLPRINFEDASVLNQSGIFRNLSIEKNLRTLIYKYRTDEFYCFYGKAMILSLIADMLTSTNRTKRECSVAQRIMEYIRLNPEKDLSGDALSNEFSYHKNYINKLIKQETGRSLSEYIRHAKIEYAKTLLSEDVCSMTELSMRLGYYDYSHFYKAFLLETGTRPTEYLPFKN